MQELLKKIEASAAARLTLPPGRQPAQELARYKAFLKVETHRLKLLHRAGGGGLEICRARAAILDVLLRYLWEAAKASLSEQARKEFPPLALVAIGGYGRAELNPHSDIDFMFLHSRQVAAGNRPLPHLSRIIDGILYPLWDIGLKVGHSVRTIEDCVKVANSDMQSKTSLIEARLIAGDEALFKRFQKALVSKCVDGHEQEYIAMRLADQAARRAKFGNSACMQEPNLKNGCGGLRDFQNLLWMAFFKYRTRSLKELQANDLISEAERKQLEAAYDFLLRVRTEMHYHVNRAMDVLGKNLQPAVAHNLGYRERSPSKRIEKFMRDVYTHSRNIFLITRTLEQRLALLPQARRLRAFRCRRLSGLLPGGRKPVTEPVDGFKFIDGEIHAASDRVFRDQPRRLMRVFLYAQQRGLRLHPDLAQLIRNQLGLVDRAFLSDEHVRETFLAILDQRGNVAPILRAMHEVDLLGKYIPEFGKLTCLVQHEFYHQYTADEHTLMCLEQLDRIWEAKAPPYSTYTPLFQKLERPFLLYLALLLHDVGKADGHGHHSEVSGELALRVAKRLGLDGAATHTLRLVIEHHLLMASVSQRRDLDDPAVIRQFAKQVQTPETLALLTLHTFADSQATSDKLWNGFKDLLLGSLHRKTLQLHDRRRRVRPRRREAARAAHAGSPPPRARALERGGTARPLRHAARPLLPDPPRPGNPGRPRPRPPLHAPADLRGGKPAGARRQLAQRARPRLQRRQDLHLGPRRPVPQDRRLLQRRRPEHPQRPDLHPQRRHRAGHLLRHRRQHRQPGRPRPARPLRERPQQGPDRRGSGFPRPDCPAEDHPPALPGLHRRTDATQIRFDNDSSDSPHPHRDRDRRPHRPALHHLADPDRAGPGHLRREDLHRKGAAIDSFYVRELTGGKVLAPERHRAIERKLRQAIHHLETR